MNIKFATVLVIVVRLFLGGTMIWGSSQKFAKPIPKPTQLIEQQEKEGVAKLTKEYPKWKHLVWITSF